MEQLRLEESYKGRTIWIYAEMVRRPAHGEDKLFEEFVAVYSKPGTISDKIRGGNQSATELMESVKKLIDMGTD